MREGDISRDGVIPLPAIASGLRLCGTALQTIHRPSFHLVAVVVSEQLAFRRSALHQSRTGSPLVSQPAGLAVLPCLRLAQAGNTGIPVPCRPDTARDRGVLILNI